jgi:anti-anti-sigma factor
MHFEQDHINNCQILRLQGHLGAQYVNQNRHELLDLVDGLKGNILLNLKYVDFIDSSGLGLIVALVKHARQKGGELLICNLSAQARSLFELTKLHLVFSIHATEEAALAALS